MLDINYIKKNIKKVQQHTKNKGYDVDFEKLLKADEQRRELLAQIENLRTDQNKISKKQGKPEKSEIDKSKAIKSKLEELESRYSVVIKEYETILSYVPNIYSEDTPIGKDDQDNVVLREVGKKPKFNFEPKDHVALAEDCNLMDNQRAVKIGGTRSYITKNEMVILEQAVLRYALDIIRKEGFEIMNVPVLIKEEALYGSGFFPFGKEDIYQVNEDNLYLVGTSEASLVFFHSGETLTEEQMPRLLSGITTCFRKEVGTYGKDTKGVIRVHQFNKVEQVVLSRPEDGEKMFNFILGISEKIVKGLELPYRVIQICSGDMGAKNHKQYDIEVWFPGQNKYRETHSCSWLTDYQARRANIKYRKTNGEKEFVHTLNNTGVATPRILAAILENNQQKDGSIVLPKEIQKYTGFEKIGHERG